MRKKLFVFLLVAIFFLTACAKQPTTLRIALSLLPDGFDALRASNRFSSLIEKNIFEPLLELDASDHLQNILIDYFFMVKDSLLVVRIKDDIKFSDGSPLTADDIVESINRFNNIRNYKTSLDFSDIIAGNDNIIHFYLRKVNRGRFNIKNLDLIPIYKGEYIRQFDDDLLRKQPLGTGPYYLYSASNTKIVLKKNRYHRDYAYMANNPDIIEYYYESNLHNQYQMLKNNEADFILDMEFVDYNDGISDPNIKIYSRLSDYFSYMALDAMSAYRKGISLPFNPLRDKRVRQAIAHSIDMEYYVQEQLSEQAIALTVPAPVQTRDYPTYLKPYSYNIQLARELLAEAGVGNGFKMALFANNGYYSMKMAEFIKASLAEINIEVEVTLFNGTELYQALLQNTPNSYIVFYGSNSMARNAEDVIRAHLNISTRQNYLKLNSKTLNTLLDSLAIENIDLERRAVLHNKMIETVYEEVMVLPLFQPFIFHALRTNIVWNTKKNNIPLAREFEMR